MLYITHWLPIYKFAVTSKYSQTTNIPDNWVFSESRCVENGMPLLRFKQDQKLTRKLFWNRRLTPQTKIAPVRRPSWKNKFIFQARWFKLRCLYLWVCNYLGGGLKYFLFSSLPGGMIQFDYFFSTGLSPPTSYVFFFRNLHHSLPIPSEKKLGMDRCTVIPFFGRIPGLYPGSCKLLRPKSWWKKTLKA